MPTNFDSLAPKEKRRIERNLISLVTGKTTKLRLNILPSNKGGTIRNAREASLRICKHEKIIHYLNCCGIISFSALPKNIALLLGIIHRP